VGELWSSSGDTTHSNRIRLTLEGNERRYQTTVRERKAGIEKIGGGSMPAYTPPTPATDYYLLWDFFLPTFSCPFPVWRVGNLGDGGKWVCGFQRATHQPKGCVVYSMGVAHHSGFERAVLHESKKCQVYGFDFSVSDWGADLREDRKVISRAHFFPWKIGGVDDHEASPPEYTLQGIMKAFGHDFIDILKIDIEGAEFPALRSMIESFKGQPLPFGQLQIEIHIATSVAPEINTLGALDEWWTMLEEAGLRPFWTEVNLLALYLLGGGPFYAEWSWINIHGNHALTDDTLPEYP